MSFKQKYLEYNNGSGGLPDGAFRISASQFNGFMSYPHSWYREQVLKEEGFKGNTASVLGTIVHGVAAAFVNGDEIDKQAIHDYAHEQAIGNIDVDPHEILSQYPLMVETLVNQYIMQNRPTQVEPFVKYEIIPGHFPSGSIDAIQNDMIIDYKTFNALGGTDEKPIIKSAPKTIPMNYKYQLLIYAYIMNKNGHNIERVRLVYVNRAVDTRRPGKLKADGTPGKELGRYQAPEVTVLTEGVSQDDLDFIESVLLLCAETHQMVVEKPNLAYLLYRDYRLKDQ